MAMVADELKSFCQFAEGRMRHGECEQTLDELYAEWRASHPQPDALSNDVLAVRAALRDMDEGVPGRAFDEFANDFRARHGI